MKPKFKIGELVSVNLKDKLSPQYDKNNNRRIVKLHSYNKETVIGRITGIKTFQEGKGITPAAYYSYDGEPVYEQPYLNVKNIVTTYAVRLGYKNKEMYFLPEDITIEEESGKDIPYLYTGWTDELKTCVSKESKNWDRDEKGRFI